MLCSNCNSVQAENAKYCENCGINLTVNSIENKITKAESNMKEYKVLTQKDRFFGGKFDPEKLEGAINSYATEGWRVIAVTTANIPSFTGAREEMIIVLERDK